MSQQLPRSHHEGLIGLLGEMDTEMRLDWAPPGVSRKVVSKYLDSLAEEKIPVQGSEAAVRRIKQLEKQFPLHDVEPDRCHQLSQGEIDKSVHQLSPSQTLSCQHLSG